MVQKSNEVIIPYKPLPYQRQLHNDPHRFRTIVAGRRVGKTTFAVNELIKLSLTRKLPIPYWYVAPFYHQAKTIAWDMLLKYVPQQLWAKKPNETELSINLVTGSKLVLKGADNPVSLEGIGLGALIVDEISAISHWQTLWQNTLRPMLGDYESPSIFISKPRGFNHFYDLAMLGDHNQIITENLGQANLDKDFITYRFQAEQNCREHNGGYIPHDEIETARRQLTEDAYNQEYLALFTRFSGLIFREFEMTRHVHEFAHEFNQHGDYYFGQDFAVRGFTAGIVGVVKPDGHVYILDNYKKESETAQTHIENEKQMLKIYADISKYTGYGDPSGFAKNQQKGDMIWSIADEYIEAGLPLVPANNEVTAGINFVRQLFKNNMIHIHPRCQLLIDELLQYQWKEMPDKQKGVIDDPEKVRKVNDHLVDALRYMCYSKPTAPEQEEAKRTTTFPIIFPPPLYVEDRKPKEDEDQLTPVDVASYLD